jgi:hypothetical protein
MDWLRILPVALALVRGLRLHLIRTPAGLPISWALADPKIDERQVLTAVLEHDPSLLTDRPGLGIIGVLV